MFEKIIKLKLTKTRHLTCHARINGIKAILLIDTGASNSCIALAQKETYDIKEKGGPFEAAGAGQDRVKAVLGHRCELILGRHKVKKQSFILLDMQHINATLVRENTAPINGILGADFFEKNKALIDYKNKILTL